MRKKIFIYATGLTARHAYEIIQGETDYQFIAFLNRSMDQYNAVSDLGECWLYNDERITDELKKNGIVIVAIMNTQGRIKEVIQRLKGEGFWNIIPYAKLADIFPDSFQFLYIESSEKFKTRMPQVEDARKILLQTGADRRSMQVFESMVAFRESKNYDDLPEIDKKENQYVPRDIPDYRTDKISFVDCGAYIGDTFETLLDYVEDVCAELVYYAGFEPDKGNYEKLKKAVEREGAGIGCTIYPYAVCESKKQLAFDMLGSTASKIRNDNFTTGQLNTEGMPIDEIEFPMIPTHIKMDIEGAEYSALMGAKKIIQEHKPKLAICIYHRPEDIYSIIQLIWSWNLGYKFQVRVYEDVGIDLVLYAV